MTASAALYQRDLAAVHHAGYGDFARGAAPALLAVLRRAGIESGAVVDLGCGSGIWLRELTRAGYDAVGVDASAAMIALARKTAPRANVQTASVYDFRLPPCDAVTALGEVLNYAPPGKQRPPSLDRLFRRVARALRPGGLFVFDVLVAGAPPMDYRTGQSSDDWTVLVAVTEDVARRRLCRDIITFRRVGRSWRRSRERHTLRVYERREVEAALRRAGFTVRATGRYGEMPLAPRRLAFWARRM